MSLYLLIDILSIAFPLAFSFHPKLRVYKEWKFLLPGILITACIFIFWDILFTQKGIWGFNPQYLQGIFLAGLPLEEYLFFFFIPYSSIFIIYALEYAVPAFRISNGGLVLLRNTLFLVFAVIAILFFDRWYTVVTAIYSLVTLLLAHRFCGRRISHFYIAFPIILIPFFIVNGILTGSFIDGEVVWYDDRENMGIRMFTIPAEDMLYAFAMILSVVIISTVLKDRNRLRT